MVTLLFALTILKRVVVFFHTKPGLVVRIRAQFSSIITNICHFASILINMGERRG